MTAENPSSNTEITPSVAEKKVSEAVEDVVDPQEFVVEEDGDFFWVLQRVSWGIIKTLLFLGVVGLLIWLIWGGGPSIGNKLDVPNVNLPSVNVPALEIPSITKEPNTPKKQPVSTSEPETITPAVQQVNIRTGRNLEALAYQLAEQQVGNTNSTITQSIAWLKQVKQVGDVSTELLRANNPSVRADKIEATIVQAETLLNLSPQLQRRLSEEFNYFFNLGQTDNQVIAQIDEDISGALGRFDGNRVETLLAQKITKQQSAARNLSQAKVRQTLLQNVQNFDRLLRQKSIPLLQPTAVSASPR